MTTLCAPCGYQASSPMPNTANTIACTVCNCEEIRCSRRPVNRSMMKLKPITASKPVVSQPTNSVQSGRPKIQDENCGRKQATRSVAPPAMINVAKAVRRSSSWNRPRTRKCSMYRPNVAGQAENRQRRGEQQEAEAHLPFAQLFRRQPAAKDQPAHETHEPLQDGQHQQNQHALGQRVGPARAPRRRVAGFGSRLITQRGHTGQVLDARPGLACRRRGEKLQQQPCRFVCPTITRKLCRGSTCERKIGWLASPHPGPFVEKTPHDLPTGGCPVADQSEQSARPRLPEFAPPWTEQIAPQKFFRSFKNSRSTVTPEVKCAMWRAARSVLRRRSNSASSRFARSGER